MEVVTASLIEWGVAARTLSGQAECGDDYVVQPFANGVLVGVVDGLGHGGEAAAAAALAVRTLEEHAGESGIALVRRCHERLRGTRGVVMSLASFTGLDSTMTWLGVGNVEGILLRRAGGDAAESEALVSRAGVVGGPLPPLSATVIHVRPGDTLILATDGIRSDFARTVIRSDSTQRIADRILARYGKVTDDALVLVARPISQGARRARGIPWVRWD